MNLHTNWESELQDLRDKFYSSLNIENENSMWTERGYRIYGNIHPHHSDFIDWAE